MYNQDKKKEKKYYTVNKLSLTIRSAVAIYLLYTVWQLREAPFTSEGTERIIFIIAIAAFFIIALAIGIPSVKALIKGEYAENNPPEPEEDEDDSEGGVS